MPRRKAISIGRSDRFTSDTHFGHRLMIAKREQPDGSVEQFRRFDTIEQHDEDLIARWNRTTGPTDLTYHLGDFAGPRTSADRKREIFDRLKGRKILLPGNHDDETTLSLGWDQVLQGPQHFRDGNGQMIVCLHWPMYEWDGWHNGASHLHGHTHGNRLSSRRRFDVGIDHAGSYPLTWNEIRDRMANLPELDIDGRLIEPFKPDRGYPQPGDLAARRNAARFSIANTGLSGGSVNPETREILERWERGEIDDETMIAEVTSKGLTL